MHAKCALPESTPRLHQPGYFSGVCTHFNMYTICMYYPMVKRVCERKNATLTFLGARCGRVGGCVLAVMVLVALTPMPPPLSSPPSEHFASFLHK